LSSFNLAEQSIVFFLDKKTFSTRVAPRRDFVLGCKAGKKRRGASVGVWLVANSSLDDSRHAEYQPELLLP
jgi:hypothetical protein